MEGFVIQQDGPNGWAVIGAGGLIGLALVIIGLALFNLATWAGWALIVLACGQAALATLTGVARIVEARERANALSVARWHVIGRAAREDIKALWGPASPSGREVGDE